MRQLRFLAIIPVLLVSLSFQNQLQGQIEGPAQLTNDKSETRPGLLPKQREYLDTDGEVLVTGELVKIEGATVTILTTIGENKELKLNQFSKEDQEYLKQRRAILKKNERYKKETLKILATLNTTSDPAKIVSACNKLRNFGPAAVKAESAMRGFFTNPDPRIKRASFRAYAAVCRYNKMSYNDLIGEMYSNTWGMLDAFESHPKDLLESFVRFEEWAYPYFRHVAFTGRLKLKSDEPDLNGEPEKFIVGKSKQNKIREAGCLILGEVKDTDSVYLLTDLLPIVEQPVSNVRDDKSLIAILKALGNRGVVNDKVVAALKKHQKEFPEVVKKSMDQIREQYKKDQAKDQDDE